MKEPDAAREDGRPANGDDEASGGVGGSGPAYGTDEEVGAPDRRPYTFILDADLVDQARREVGESDVVRSIEAALAAAIDYQVWIREVTTGERDVLA